MANKQSLFPPEMQDQLAATGAAIARAVREWVKDPKNRAEFEEWHLKTYGEPYKWD